VHSGVWLNAILRTRRPKRHTDRSKNVPKQTSSGKHRANKASDRDCAIDSRMAAHHTCGMKRTTIWLSDQQVKGLAKLSRRTGIKQAELIRRFIDAGIAKSAARK